MAASFSARSLDRALIRLPKRGGHRERVKAERKNEGQQPTHDADDMPVRPIVAGA